MRKRAYRCIAKGAPALIGAAFIGSVANAQIADDNLDALVDARDIPVTVDNFVRAATDIELAKYVALAGGVNQFYHFREPTPVADQPTIHMNRDTLYSTAVVDISEGATLTLPEVGDRYMAATFATPFVIV